MQDVWDCLCLCFWLLLLSLLLLAAQPLDFPDSAFHMLRSPFCLTSRQLWLVGLLIVSVNIHLAFCLSFARVEKGSFEYLAANLVSGKKVVIEAGLYDEVATDPQLNCCIILNLPFCPQC